MLKRLARVFIAWVALLAIVSAYVNVVTFSDAFTRADNTNLGADWDPGYTSFTNAQIVSNAVRGTSTSVDSLETVGTTINSGDQWAQITFTTIGAGVSAPGLWLEMAAPATVSGYFCQALVGVGGTTTRIRSYASGTPTNLTTENATTWASGNTMLFRKIGSTLECYRNGTLLLTTTSATYTSGRVGIGTFNDTSTANVILDNFSAGNVSCPNLTLLGTGC